MIIGSFSCSSCTTVNLHKENTVILPGKNINIKTTEVIKSG